MKKQFLLSLMLLGASATAQDYQLEIGAEYETNDSADVLGVSAQGFFSQVKTEGHALREAAFMERKSNIYGSYLALDIDGSDSSDNAGEIGLQLFIPQIYGYIEPMYREDDDGDWGIRAGFTPIKGLLLTTTYWDEPGYDANLQAKYVADLPGSDAVNVEFSYYDGEEDDTVEFELDYYFGPALSLGAVINHTVDTNYTIQGEKFFAERFAVNASYTFGENDDTVGIGMSYRF